jgi:amino acid transporter
MALEEFGYRQELHRSLTTRDLIVYGMIFMVPIAPYSVFGFVWNDSKGMVPLAYLLGLVGMFFTALSYAAMSRAFPLAGSVYTYAQRGLHDIAGFFSGWLILLDYILVPWRCGRSSRPFPRGCGSAYSSLATRPPISSA